MKNDVLEELWESKDTIAEENNYDIDLLAKKLIEKQKKKKHKGIDLSHANKSTA